jgi:type IV pilus assembly protein PilQ
MNRHIIKRIGIIFALVVAFAVAFSSQTVAEDILSSDKPLSVKVRDADIRDVLRIIAEEYGLNIVIGRGVEGRISYEIENTTLRAGLEAILKSNGLGYIIDDNIIRVDDLTSLRAELQDQLEIRRAQQQLREARKLDKPLQTREITLDYIGDTLSSRRNKAEKLKEVLEPLLSHRKERGIDRGANVQLLEETNTLLVTDVEENLKEIEAVAKALDKPRAQVRIEARVVEINHSDAFALGIQWGGKYQQTRSDGSRTTAIGGRRGSNTGGLITNVGQGATTPQNLGIDLPLIGDFSPVGTIGFALLDNLSLDIELQALEEKGKLKLVSRPSLQVLENEDAEILIGQQIPVAAGLDPETGQVEVTQQDIGTSLKITPQITQDRTVILRVEVERSSIGDPTIIQGEPFDTINKKNAASQVRVSDGETVVIGGLVTTDEREGRQGVPFFSKVPVVGLLFRNRTESSSFDETMIFLTPHIVNPEDT